MDAEAEGFRAMLEERNDAVVSGLFFSEGTLSGHRVIVVKCGVGKVNAALCTQTAVLRYAPDAVINVGVAGGVGQGVLTGHVVVASDTIQYDFDLTALGEEDGLAFSCDPELSGQLSDAARAILPAEMFHYGRIATGDRFVGDSVSAAHLSEHYEALACEMEGGAVAQVCSAAGVKCAVVRAVSDNANEHSNVDFATFLSGAVKTTEKIITAFLRLS
jgi:adenosylhomocysteine nucleosidase